ncbi:acetyl-coenzyme A synthetase N-terminal domain-containing protein, partial [Thalassovita sp.]|uniref:acetyl-coenzyme A synthetase N-terminal domain-containing protein n=1 Tax=Thalassovita sp. TaxID=1979401 RepID=UPI002B264738
MSENLYPVPKSFSETAHVDAARYDAMYAASVSDPDGFWREQGQRVDWIKPYTKVKNT